MLCLSVGLTAGIALGQGGETNVLRDLSEASSEVRLSRQGGAGSQDCRASQYSNGSLQCMLGTLSIVQVRADGNGATERVVDVPPTSVSPQGRTQVAAAEDSRDETGSAEDDARRVEGAAVLSVVSYSLLGEIVAAHPWPTSEAFAIVSCESNWTAGAISWTGARGLMQLMPVHAWRFARRGWDYWVDVFVPERNVAIGYELWLEQGWGIWSCS